MHVRGPASPRAASRPRNLIAVLTNHDLTVAAAAADGRAANYDAALATLARASAALDGATEIRDQLANTSDMTTLDTWLSRNRRYDAALVGLYSAFRDSGGVITDAVRIAFTEESAARAILPDTRGLVLIVADIGRGGLNQAVIAIEQARGRLTLALQALAAARRQRVLTYTPTREIPGHPTERRDPAQLPEEQHPCACVSRPTNPGMSAPTSSIVPIVGDPDFDGPLGELDRRSKGELKALAAFGELRPKRFTSAIATSGDVTAGRLLTISAGEAAGLDRELVARIGSAALHRLAGRHVLSVAICLDRWPRSSRVAPRPWPGCSGRGVVEGGFDPKSLYLDDVPTAPPALGELILVAPGGRPLRRAAARPIAG